MSSKVQSAKNLRVKSKHGNNDTYVTIQLGKEKYQTSVQEKTSLPEWHEECELTIPDGNSSAIILTVFHRNFVGLDRFLGRVEVPLQELDIYERPKNKWFSLLGKKSKNDLKDRGDLEVRFAFVVKSVTGSLMDLSKKPKKSGSLPLKMVQNFGGSLMSLGGKDKKFSLSHLKGKLSDKLPRRKSPKSEIVTDFQECHLDHDDDYDDDAEYDCSDIDNMSTASSTHTSDHPTTNLNGSEYGSSTNLTKINKKPLTQFSSTLKQSPLNDSDALKEVALRKTTYAIHDDISSMDLKSLSARNTNHNLLSSIEAKSVANPANNNNGQTGIDGRALQKNDNPSTEQLSNQRRNIRSSVPKEIVTLYNAMTKQELVDLLCKQHNIIEKQQCHVQDLESYIDDLLVRVMDTSPRLLQNPYKRASSFM